MAKSGILITWEWWEPTRSGSREPTAEHQEQLDEHALEHAMQMIGDGFVEGELNAHIGDDERNYRGYWKRQSLNE